MWDKKDNFTNLKNEKDQISSKTKNGFLRNTLEKVFQILEKTKNTYWENSEKYKNTLTTYLRTIWLIKAWKDKLKNETGKELRIILEEVKHLEYVSSELPIPVNNRNFFEKVWTFASERYLESIKKDDELIWFKNWEHILIKITDFEIELWVKSINEINSKTFASYLEYLNKKWINISIKLLDKLWDWDYDLWATKINHLVSFWEKKDDTIAKKILKWKNLWEIMNQIEKANNCLKNIDSFITEVNKPNISKEELELISAILWKKYDIYMSKFKKQINSAILWNPKFKNEKERKVVFDEILPLIEKLDKSDIKKIASTFLGIKNKYKLESLSIKEATENITTIHLVDTQRKLINLSIEEKKIKDKIKDAKKRKDTHEIEELTTVLDKFKTGKVELTSNTIKASRNIVIANTFSEKTIVSIWNWTTTVEKEVAKLRKENIEFDDKIKNLEELWIKYNIEKKIR